VTQSPEGRGLGLALVDLRRKRGHSRPDLARMASLSYPYFAELEKGRKVPSQDALERLAGALDVTPSELGALGEQLARQVGDTELVQAATPVESPALAVYATPGQSPVALGAEDDPVDALTADVMKRIQPIVRAAIAQALQERR
jgi:predicted transcriptional regulator